MSYACKGCGVHFKDPEPGQVIHHNGGYCRDLWIHAALINIADAYHGLALTGSDLLERSRLEAEISKAYDEDCG